jgi:hypothetical protein
MAIPPDFVLTIKQINRLFSPLPLDWAITGSLSFALQGMPLDIHDIDLQTDQAGAYEIEKLLRPFMITPVYERRSDTMRSYFGEFNLNGIKAEVMGAIQKKINGNWEDPVDIRLYRTWISYQDMLLPVLDLHYDYKAYTQMGRLEKAAEIKNFLGL